MENYVIGRELFVRLVWQQATMASHRESSDHCRSDDAARPVWGQLTKPNLKHVNVERLGAGANIAEIARKFKTTRQTIMRVKEAALKLPPQQKE